MEVFEFMGEVYKSALKAPNLSRVEKQLEAVSPYVDEILIYQYQGFMNSPDTISCCGHPDSKRLYDDYLAWMKKNDF